MASVPTSDSHSLSGGEKRLLEGPASQVLDKTAPQFPFTSSKEELDLERRAIARLDLTVLPVMTMFYLLSFLDRANIGNARVAGLQNSLSLTDHQYQICVTILYVPYICTELPANLLLRRIGPNVLMPTVLTLWGIVVTFQGFVTNYYSLLVVRFLLGALEGPMFPSMVLYLSSFYTRRDLSLRIACFFSAASLSGAFSGLLAAAISLMDGYGGKSGWSWIFILEGLFTVLMGLISFFLVPATPQQARFLTQEEKDAIERRLQSDRPLIGAKEAFSVRDIIAAILSPHVCIMIVALFIGGTMLFGLALFLPSIVRQLGFSPLRTQLLSVGPFAVGFIVSMAAAWYSDKYNRRGVPLLIISILSIIGWATFLCVRQPYAMYGALYLMVPGIYATSPVSCAWVANNSEPYFRRGSAIAIAFMATSCGGILSTWRFPTNEGPRFTKTATLNLVFSCFAFLLVCMNMLYLHLANQRKERMRSEILEPYATEKELDGGSKAWLELGDRHPDFKYTL